jgi:membrane-associated phospholipid phosphatase
MEELRQFNQKNKYSDIAWKWKSIPVWDNLLDHLIIKYQLDFHPLKAAKIYACFHITRYEATLSAWEAKYHYMGIRPFQYDTTFQPILLTTPNFPGYPAGHTTVAGALAEIITHFFPSEAQHAKRLALECSESRFEGGVHFRTDNEVGLQQGKRVGQAIIRHIEE